MRVGGTKPVSAVWKVQPSKRSIPFQERLRISLDRRSQPTCVVMFRADDIAVPGINYQRLVHLFAKYQMPLCLALVPAWLTHARWQVLQRMTPQGHWCWHQHGWRHANHALTGKKAEFGATRPISAIQRDARAGWQRLRQIVGAPLYPVFTPPWNRLHPLAVEPLRECGFKGVSTFDQALDLAGGLPDLAMTVDLHTRKSKQAQCDFDQLIAELGAGLSQGYCGIMIHHQRMNPHAFVFLNALLEWLTAQRELQCFDFRDLLTKLGGSELMNNCK